MAKKKMQDVDFQSIQEFLDYLPTDELEMVLQLRELVLECLPKVKEKLSFNTPFYHGNRAICFIWPGSIGWGGKSTPGKVQIGFTKGYLMKSTPYLDQGKRTQVFVKDFYHAADIRPDILRELLYEAAEIDSTFAPARYRR